MAGVRSLIREKLKARNVSLKEASEAIGKNHAYLQQYLTRGIPSELPERVRERLAPILGLSQSDLREVSTSVVKKPQFTAHFSQIGTADQLMVLGMGEGGDGWEMWNGEVVDTVPRPPNLKGVVNAYAVFVRGDSMDPRYLPGEVLFIHPDKPVSPGCFVLVQMYPLAEGEGPRAMIKRLVRRGPTKTTLEQLNPRKTFELKNSEIAKIDRIVGSGEA